MLFMLQLGKRTIRVDHVEEYKKPKDETEKKKKDPKKRERKKFSN